MLSPNEYITRQEVARIIGRVYNINNTSKSITTFNDSFIIPKDISGIIGTMVDKGILSGYPDGTFRPNSNITRAEIVTIINNVLKNLDDIVKVTVDKSKLKALIGEAKNLDNDDYTKTTRNKLKEVLELAIEIFEDENATQEEVDGILEKLEDVIDNIKKVSKSTSSNGRDDNYTPNIIKVNSITVTSAGNVTTVVNGGTLQMNAVIAPYNATDKTVTWSVTISTGSATIDTNGLLTALEVGTVTVKAEAKDGSGKYGEKEIVVEGDSTDHKEYEQFLNKHSAILNIDLNDIETSHITDLSNLIIDLRELSVPNASKFFTENLERLTEILDTCLVYKWAKDVQLTNGEGNMRDLINLILPFKMDETSEFESLTPIQQTEVAKFFILTRETGLELSKELYNSYIKNIKEATSSYVGVLTTINTGEPAEQQFAIASLGNLFGISLTDEEIHILIHIMPQEGYESVTQMIEMFSDAEFIIEGKEYLEYFKDILITDLSDITYKDYQPAEEALYWLSDLSPKAYTYISGDTVAESLEDKIDSAFEDILDKFTNTEDIGILSYMIKDRFGWYEGPYVIKLSDLSGIFIHVRNHTVTFEYSNLEQVEETLEKADKIMWDVIGAANEAEDIEELRTLMDEYMELTSTYFSDAQLENILTNPLRGIYFELTEVLIAAEGDIKKGLEYLRLFELIMENELSTIEIRDYFYIEDLLYDLDELNMDSYNYIDGNALRVILNKMMDEVMPLVENALYQFTNSNDVDIISEIAQQIYLWYSEEIMFDDLSYIFIYLRDASAPIDYTDLEDVGEMLWDASEIMEDVIDTANTAANIEELRENLKFYMELTSTKFEDGQLENILANRPLKGYKSLTEVLNGSIQIRIIK